MSKNSTFFSEKYFTEKGFAKSQDVEIYYECFGKKGSPAIVLIMGLDTQCYLWSMPFIEPLVEAGFQVIRFDNRDIGLSTWLTNWQKTKPYTLEDMALDVVHLLDHLSIQKSHIIGASMGGMIAQRLAISHAERVLSLTCIMSTAWALDPAGFTNYWKKLVVKTAPYLIKYLSPPHKYVYHKVTVGRYLATYKWLAGKKYEFDKPYYISLFKYLIEERKGQNPRAMFQQFCAVMASGPRFKELPKIQAPTLAIHGTADKLMPVLHSRKYIKYIPKGQLVEIEGIGHEIPKAELPNILKVLVEHLSQNKEMEELSTNYSSGKFSQNRNELN